eukprot:jgi/Mesvir1/12637/Mv02193-RA.1
MTTGGHAHDNEKRPPSPRSCLESLKSDETLSKFLSPDFDATEFASRVLATGQAQQCSATLGEGIRVLEKELRSEVIERHQELLQQVGSLKETENVLGIVRAGASSLQASIQRVRAELSEPYAQARLRTKQISSLLATVELLRRVIRLLKQAAKLREQLHGTGKGGGDLAKAAQLYTEIELIRREADLSGVDVVDREVPWIEEAGEQIREQADALLRTGMQSLNQAEVGTVLQVYFNLGALPEAVADVVDDCTKNVRDALSRALDAAAISAQAAPSSGGPGGSTGPGGAQRMGGPAVGGSARWQEVLWQNVQQCTEQIYSAMLAVWHLQRVLVKKRDPVSHVCFLDEIVKPGQPLVTEEFWTSFVSILTEHLTAAHKDSMFVREAFIHNYPALVAVFHAMLDKLAHDTDFKGVSRAVRPEGKADLAAAMASFEMGYLSAAVARVDELVAAVFPSSVGGRSLSIGIVGGATSGASGVVAPEHLKALLQGLEREVSAVVADERLTGLVVHKVVAHALRSVMEKAEYQMGTGPDARQVAGFMTSAQQRNVALYHCSQDIFSCCMGIAATIPYPPAVKTLQSAMDAMQGVALDMLRPMFRAMMERLEKTVASMHKAGYGGASTTKPAGGSVYSAYINELEQSVTHFATSFFVAFQSSPSATSSTPSAASTGGWSGRGSSATAGTGTGAAAMSASSAAAAAAAASHSLVDSLKLGLATRVLVFFVRHAALLRPSSEAGRLQLAQDMTELELVIGQNVYPMEGIGAPYASLRAFRRLLFLETAQIPTSPILHDLPASAVLHHLFSRGPDELQLPHVKAGLSVLQYSIWLDQHSEEDVWRGVKSSLEAYAHSVNMRGDPQYDPIYPLMMSLGPVLMEEEAKKKKGN